MPKINFPVTKLYTLQSFYLARSVKIFGTTLITKKPLDLDIEQGIDIIFAII